MKGLTDVKKIRTTLGMSQKQLADALGMSSRSVAAWGHSVGQRVTLIYARLDTAQVDAAVVAVSRAVGG